MSILTQLLHKQITFSQAADEVAHDVQQAFSGNPQLQQAAGQILSDAKQVASNFVAYGDTILGNLLTGAVPTVEGALQDLVTKYLGANPTSSAATHDAVQTAANALKGVIDNAALSVLSQIGAGSQPPKS